jgi:hypothetical protein
MKASNFATWLWATQLPFAQSIAEAATLLSSLPCDVQYYALRVLLIYVGENVSDVTRRDVMAVLRDFQQRWSRGRDRPREDPLRFALAPASSDCIGGSCGICGSAAGGINTLRGFNVRAPAVRLLSSCLGALAHA